MRPTVLVPEAALFSTMLCLTLPAPCPHLPQRIERLILVIWLVLKQILPLFDLKIEPTRSSISTLLALAPEWAPLDYAISSFNSINVTIWAFPAVYFGGRARSPTGTCSICRVAAAYDDHSVSDAPSGDCLLGSSPYYTPNGFREAFLHGVHALASGTSRVNVCVAR